MSKYYIEIDVPLMSPEWKDRIIKVLRENANIRNSRILSEKELMEKLKDEK